MSVYDHKKDKAEFLDFQGHGQQKDVKDFGKIECYESLGFMWLANSYTRYQVTSWGEFEKQKMERKQKIVVFVR